MDAIFLDLGGVVIEIDFSRTLAHLGLESSVDLKRFVEELHDTELYHRFERGHAAPEEFFAMMRDMLGGEIAIPTLQKAWRELIVGELDGIGAVFDEFKGKVPLYALSNTNIAHVQHQFGDYPILERFDRLFLSCEMGHRKPDREIFLEAARAVGAKPERCVFIDDNLPNIEGARRAGFQAFQSVNDPALTLKLLRQAVR